MKMKNKEIEGTEQKFWRWKVQKLWMKNSLEVFKVRFEQAGERIS